jgi:hypothetical protein
LRSFAKLLLIVVLAFPQAAFAQTAAPVAPTLRVQGMSGPAIVLTAPELAAMPRQSAEVVDEKGHHVSYQGVSLFEILRRVGIPTGHDLRGKQMTLYVLVTAADGYRAIFALLELDPDFTDRQILLVDRRDGAELSAAEGPFRIIVPGEKRHARWVHNVFELDLKRAEEISPPGRR